MYLVKVYEKQNKATKENSYSKENAMRVFRKQNEYRTAAGVEKLEWSDGLYDFLIYRMNKSGYDEHKNLNADTRDYFGTFMLSTKDCYLQKICLPVAVILHRSDEALDKE